MLRQLAKGKDTAIQFALGLLPMGKLDANGTGPHETPVLSVVSTTMVSVMAVVYIMAAWLCLSITETGRG